jgi:site-specific DNA-methyltransferase (adenine-specific)
MLGHGNGRDLSFIEDESVDAIITDHPYDIKASNNGGDRHFATYDCFCYTQEDFNEKARVLKPGCFLIEFLPEENADNYEYLYQIKQMAKAAGFKYYSKVAWKKGDFISNCGRKSKNTEDVMIFSKGEPRALRIDAKKDKAEPGIKHFMKGTSGMLPTSFDYAKPSKKDMIHQAEKPVELLEAILEYTTKENELILDQFAGSGALGEAAQNKKRKCILIELSDEFVDRIRARLDLKKGGGA